MRRLLVLLPSVLLAACTTPGPSPAPSAAGPTASPAATPFPDDGVGRVSCEHVIGVEEPGAATNPTAADANARSAS